MTDRLSYEDKKELPDSVYGLPERREYPMPDAHYATGIVNVNLAPVR